MRAFLLPEKFNRGQININLVNKWGQRLRAGFLIWSTRNRQPALSLYPHLLEINVDLTPIGSCREL